MPPKNSSLKRPRASAIPSRNCAKRSSFSAKTIFFKVFAYQQATYRRHDPISFFVIVNISGHTASSRPWSAPKAPAQPTILLVDDDPLQAFVRKAILLRRFDHVERVASPADAFILVEQPAYAEKISLVIVGLHLPGLGGPDFVSELTARLPWVHVLVLGGTTDKQTDYSGDNVRYLPKFLAAENLLTKCRQMLDRRIPRAV